MRAALLAMTLAACVPSERSVQHVLLDHGLDDAEVVGWAPTCTPRRGARFKARRPTGEAVTGMVCCARDHYACEVAFTSPAPAVAHR